MLIIPDIVRIVRKRPAVAAAPATLTLVGATYEAGASVTLVFDRAIDVAAMSPDAWVVADGVNAWQLAGVGPPTLLSPTTVLIELEILGAAGGAGVRLTSPAPTGIVSAEGDLAWAGCEALALPFGGP